MSNRELKNYVFKFKITDRMMKPKAKDFTKTNERLNWEEKIEVNQAPTEQDAILAATFTLGRMFPINKYDIELIK